MTDKKGLYSSSGAFKQELALKRPPNAVISALRMNDPVFGFAGCVHETL
jgi:hypothetical protein